MTLVVDIDDGDETATSSAARSGVSWAAVLAGAAVMAAMTFLLLSLGVGLGLSVVSPWSGSGVSPTTFKIGTGIYFIVIAMISSGLGGHVAGRLRRRYAGIHDNEVYFRDTANGFVAWAVASVIGAVFLASAANMVVGGALTGATASAASRAQDGGPTAGYVDRLLRADPAATVPAGNATGNNSDARGELTRLLATSFRDRKDLKPDDRAYVAQVVARRTGLSQADAEKRVDDVITEAKADLDAARKATLQLALWLTASLFLGAFAASIAAAEGGAIRDRNWGVPSRA
jgi:hypothetical protein